MRALILSAGMGERLRPLTLKRAKPAIEFLNMPMLAFPYYWLDSVDLSAAVFNTHYLPETVRKAAMHVVKPECQTHFSHEDAILGSGGGIWNARFHLQWDGNFAVANADGVVTFPEPDTIEQMLRFHEKHDALATLLVCPLEGVGTRIPGVWMDKFGEVTNFGKASRKDYLECFHYASYMFLSKRIWDFLPEGESNILYDVLEPAIAKGEKVLGFKPAGMRWFETGNSAEYLKATRECLEFMRDGSPLGHPFMQMLDRFGPTYSQKSDLSQLRLIADSSELTEINLRGFNVIGADTKLEPGVQLQDCVILPGAHLRSGESHKSEVII
ncbi:MAG: nucleotidyltransferase family protein [Bdellovibrionales bacterium]